MHLREYLWKKNLTIKSFSEKIQYDPRYISSVMRRKIKPGRKLTAIIEEITGGYVTLYDLDPDAEFVEAPESSGL